MRKFILAAVAMIGMNVFAGIHAPAQAAHQKPAPADQGENYMAGGGG